MTHTSINILIGGEAGQGLVTIGQALGKALVRKGYYLHVTQSYQSRIRGGHNTFALRAGVVPLASPTESIDLLAALDKATLELHSKELSPGALMLSGDEAPQSGPGHLRLPLASMAKGEHRNTIVLGVLGALLGLDKRTLSEALAFVLGKQAADSMRRNEEHLDKAYAWLQEQHTTFPPLAAPPMPENTNLMLNGNEALALGALAGGLKFCSFYPMSPSTSVPLTLAGAAPSMDLVIEQVEDEIAAVNMAIGAAYAGAPALVSTSGGGFALMTEGVSLAGITETPLVIVIAMRPGPGTGLPTRTEQGDLDFVLHAGHGEFPRVIFAPSGPEECFALARRALVQAERWQGPVFILTDQYLADSYRNCAPIAPEPPEATPRPADDPSYQRYVVTEDGVSPRALPGMGKALVLLDSDEHDARGHLTEDLSLRIVMQDKRMRKLRGLTEDSLPPCFTGPDKPDVLLVCWGSTLGAVEEAAEALRKRGTRAGVCHFSQVWPLRPETFTARFAAAREVVVVESNCTGQLAGVLRRETGFATHRAVLRYDGLPMTARYILDSLAGAKERTHVG